MNTDLVNIDRKFTETLRYSGQAPGSARVRKELPEEPLSEGNYRTNRNSSRKQMKKAL